MKKPPYVREYKDRHGITRLEFRRKGHKGWPLRQPLRSPEFWEDYDAAKEGTVPPGVAAKNGSRWLPAKAGSIRWLCTEYRKSAAYQVLGMNTKRVRSGILDRFCQEHGDKPYRQLERHHLLKIRDKRATTPEAANSLIKALRQVFRFAVEYEYSETNPAKEVGLLASRNPEGFHAWSLEELLTFERCHPIGTKARLALALMLYAGCARSSDVCRLGRQHLTNDGRLRYTQFKGRNKTPVEIDVPVIDALSEIDERSPTGDLTFLVTDFQRPFQSSKSFGNWFKKRCREAGLHHCSAHGVRKVAAARLAELGCSDHEIMAIGGWKTLKEVQRYTRSARKKVLSDSAMKRVQSDIDRTKVSNFSADAKKVRQRGVKK